MNILINLFYSLFYIFRGNKPKNSKIVQILDPYTWNQHENIFMLASDKNKNKKWIMDIGAGSQWPKSYFTENGFTYHGCDIKESINSKLQDFLVVDELIPVNSSTYDLVISLSVLEHLESPEKSLREIFRILKPNGELFLQTNFLYPEHGGPQDFYRFTVYGLNKIVHESGFEVKSIEKIGNRFTLVQHNILYSYLNFLHTRVDNFFSRNSLSKLFYLPCLFFVWLLNLLLSLPLFVLLITLHYFGLFVSRKKNVFYTGVAVHAIKVS
jgi:SAM-dependent methyltransferase